MSAAVQPFARNGSALAVSLALHGSLLVLPLLLGLAGRFLHPAPRADSVALHGSSLETEAPTPEPAAGESAAGEIEVDTSEGESAPPAAEAPAEPVAIAAPEPEPRPKPAVAKPRPKPAAAAAPTRPAAAAAQSGATAAAPGAPAAGSFGSEGLPPGVRRLGYAFTRAIPVATPADATWRELPVGAVGTIRISLSVDEQGRLGELEHWQGRPGEPKPPAALERMVQKTVLLLRAGQFALSGSNQPGSERLLIEVQLRDEAPEAEATEEVVQKKFEGAAPGRPGKAYFRYGTGRVFEAKITILPGRD